MYDVTELYRQIGKVYKANGADRVILLRSRKHVQDDGMSLEVAVDGFIDKDILLKESRRLWPDIEMTVLDLNEAENEELLNEAIEDGILL